jgi:hypothetical protein
MTPHERSRNSAAVTRLTFFNVFFVFCERSGNQAAVTRQTVFTAAGKTEPWRFVVFARGKPQDELVEQTLAVGASVRPMG